MTRTTASALLAAVLLLLSARLANAWSNKEHNQLARIAAGRLIADPATPDPLDMKGEEDYFLRKRIGIIPKGADGIPFWATMPDMVSLSTRGDKVEPYGVGEDKLHYVDVEYLMADESRRTYRHDLSNKPKLSDFPDDVKDARYQRAGLLPFRVRECYGKLVDSI